MILLQKIYAGLLLVYGAAANIKSRRCLTFLLSPVCSTFLHRLCSSWVCCTACLPCIPEDGFVSWATIDTLDAVARFCVKPASETRNTQTTCYTKDTRAPRPLRAQFGEGATRRTKGPGFCADLHPVFFGCQEMGYRTCRQTFGDQADVVAFLPARASVIWRQGATEAPSLGMVGGLVGGGVGFLMVFPNQASVLCS